MQSKRIEKYRENFKSYREKNHHRIIGTNKYLFLLFSIVTIIFWPMRFYVYSFLEDIHLHAERIFWTEFFCWLELLSFIVYAYIHFRILKKQQINEERGEMNNGRIKFIIYSILIIFVLLLIETFLESIISLLFFALFPPFSYSISPDFMSFIDLLYGAMGEELFNRGLLVFCIGRLIQKKTDDKKKITLYSMLLSSLIFSALHFRRYPILENGLYPYIILFLGGITLFAIAYYCGLLFSSFAHFILNFFIVFGFYLWFVPFSFMIVLVISIFVIIYKHILKRRLCEHIS